MDKTDVLERLQQLHDRINSELPPIEMDSRGETSSTDWPAWQEWVNGPPWRNG
jgi:hypothetical protein